MPDYQQSGPSGMWGGYGLGFGHGGSGGGGGGFGDAASYNNAAFNRKHAGDLQRDHDRSETERARIAADASMYPATLKQARFGQLAPMIAGIGQKDAFAGTFGSGGPGPEISVGPVWTQGQINQQVNASRSFNNASTQNQQRNTAAELAGRGFGSNSPLQMALQNGQAMQNLMANTNADRQIRWDSAQGNSTQLLKSQTAREGQFANRQQEDIERRKGSNQFQSALMAALASLE